LNNPQLVDALSLLLPASPFHKLLSTLPEPEPTMPTKSSVYPIQLALSNSLPTLLQILEITEREEDRRISTEVDKRRQRLGGARLTADETRKAVKREIMADSKVPGIKFHKT
jgi:superkiller protein 3